MGWRVSGRAGPGPASDDATATAPAAMGPVGSGSQERLNSSDTAGTEGLLRSGSFTASSQSSKDSLGFAAGPQAQPAADAADCHTRFIARMRET